MRSGPLVLGIDLGISGARRYLHISMLVPGAVIQKFSEIYLPYMTIETPITIYVE